MLEVGDRGACKTWLATAPSRKQRRKEPAGAGSVAVDADLPIIDDEMVT
jgi:hypothetical protein